MKIIKLIIFLLVLAVLFAPIAQAQQCGRGFNIIKILDSKGKSIRGVIVELVARLPEENYGELTYGNGKFIKMSVPDAKVAIKRKLPMDFTEDNRVQKPVKTIRWYN